MSRQIDVEAKRKGTSEAGGNHQMMTEHIAGPFDRKRDRLVADTRAERAYSRPGRRLTRLGRVLEAEQRQRDRRDRCQLLRCVHCSDSSPP
jgi:hypothetical protein